MPMAGQNPVLDRTPVKRKTKMRATVVEREDTAPVVDDEQWTHTPTDDDRPPRLQLLQRPDANPLIGRMLVTRLAHRPSLRRYWRRPLRQRRSVLRQLRCGAEDAAASHSSICRQPVIADCCGRNQRESRVSSRPARRWRCSAIPRWFGLTVMPNSREREEGTSLAVAPSPCAWTARRVASLSDMACAGCAARALPRMAAGAGVGAVRAGRPRLHLSVVSILPNRVSTRSATSSSLSWAPSFSRSASSRARPSETFCFSCPISSNVAICSLPLPPIPNIVILHRYFEINGGP